MTIQSPFQSLDYGFLIDGFNQNMQMEPTLGSLIEIQSKEIDLYVQQQNNMLRINIHHQHKRHLVSLLQALESRAGLIMRKKQEEVGIIENRILQLEACLMKLKQDKDAWENAARESEAMAISLTNAIEQMKSPCLSSTGGGEEEKGEEMSSWRKEKREESTGCCKICRVRDSCMLLLPCRHMCCCEICDASIGSCPVCDLGKEASVEVFLA